MLSCFTMMESAGMAYVESLKQLGRYYHGYSPPHRYAYELLTNASWESDDDAFGDVGYGVSSVIHVGHDDGALLALKAAERVRTSNISIVEYLGLSGDWGWVQSAADTAITVKTEENAHETYTRGNELQLPNCANYSMDNLQRLSDVNYVPTKEDVLYARGLTSGVVEIQF
ncbi:hypothetical protein C5167_011709, partial [Papaver somniferum]